MQPRRIECKFPGCERRRWKTEMAKVRTFHGDWADFYWTTIWVCSEHLPKEIRPA